MPASSLDSGRVWGRLSRRFRFLVSLCVLGLLYWPLMSSLEREAGRASLVAERVILNQLRAALVVKSAEIGLTRQQDFRAWVGINPMLLVVSPPAAYDGECAEGLPSGHWCFETGGAGPHGPVGLLRYRTTTKTPQNETGNDVQKWSVVLEYNDRNGNNHKDSEDLVTGLKLVSLLNRARLENKTAPGGQN